MFNKCFDGIHPDFDELMNSIFVENMRIHYIYIYILAFVTKCPTSSMPTNVLSVNVNSFELNTISNHMQAV